MSAPLLCPRLVRIRSCVRDLDDDQRRPAPESNSKRPRQQRPPLLPLALALTLALTLALLLTPTHLSSSLAAPIALVHAEPVEGAHSPPAAEVRPQPQPSELPSPPQAAATPSLVESAAVPPDPADHAKQATPSESATAPSPTDQLASAAYESGESEAAAGEAAVSPQSIIIPIPPPLKKIETPVDASAIAEVIAAVPALPAILLSESKKEEELPRLDDYKQSVLEIVKEKQASKQREGKKKEEEDAPPPAVAKEVPAAPVVTEKAAEPAASSAPLGTSTPTAPAVQVAAAVDATSAAPAAVPSPPAAASPREALHPAAIPRPPETDAGALNRDRFNYAAFDAGAKLLATSSGMKKGSSILVHDDDRYMMVPCEAAHKHLVVQLSEDIIIDTIELANLEHYASSIRDFQVLGSATHPTSSWLLLGTYTALESTQKQVFTLPSKEWVRFIKLRWISHYGTEYYCTLTYLRVYGTTMLETFREEMQKSEDDVKEITQELSNIKPRAANTQEETSATTTNANAAVAAAQPTQTAAPLEPITVQVVEPMVVASPKPLDIASLSIVPVAQPVSAALPSRWRFEHIQSPWGVASAAASAASVSSDLVNATESIPPISLPVETVLFFKPEAVEAALPVAVEVSLSVDDGSLAPASSNVSSTLPVDSATNGTAPAPANQTSSPLTQTGQPDATSLLVNDTAPAESLGLSASISTPDAVPPTPAEPIAATPAAPPAAAPATSAPSSPPAAPSPIPSSQSSAGTSSPTAAPAVGTVPVSAVAASLATDPQLLAEAQAIVDRISNPVVKEEASKDTPVKLSSSSSSGGVGVANGGGGQRSIFKALTNRIKELEIHQALTTNYVSDLADRYVKDMNMLKLKLDGMVMEMAAHVARNERQWAEGWALMNQTAEYVQADNHRVLQAMKEQLEEAQYFVGLVESIIQVQLALTATLLLGYFLGRWLLTLLGHLLTGCGVCRRSKAKRATTRHVHSKSTPDLSSLAAASGGDLDSDTDGAPLPVRPPRKASMTPQVAKRDVRHAQQHQRAMSMSVQTTRYRPLQPSPILNGRRSSGVSFGLTSDLCEPGPFRERGEADSFEMNEYPMVAAGVYEKFDSDEGTGDAYIGCTKLSSWAQDREREPAPPVRRRSSLRSPPAKQAPAVDMTTTTSSDASPVRQGREFGASPRLRNSGLLSRWLGTPPRGEASSPLLGASPSTQHFAQTQPPLPHPSPSSAPPLSTRVASPLPVPSTVSHATLPPPALALHSSPPTSVDAPASAPAPGSRRDRAQTLPSLRGLLGGLASVLGGRARSSDISAGATLDCATAEPVSHSSSPTTQLRALSEAGRDPHAVGPDVANCEAAFSSPSAPRRAMLQSAMSPSPHRLSFSSPSSTSRRLRESSPLLRSSLPEAPSPALEEMDHDDDELRHPTS